MREFPDNTNQSIVSAVALTGALASLYAAVVVKLGLDWWTDENYSHGLLVPFVIAFILWKAWSSLKTSVEDGKTWLGSLIVAMAIILLFAGTLGAELFTTRISLVLMLAGVTIYLFGTKILQFLALPFALLLLAIPIPQIVFNRIAFPLQIWASQMAVWGIRLFEVPTVRSGNVIDILPRGSTQAISLEVVEACSGIRSMMTLVTLALILAYFTRQAPGQDSPKLSLTDFLRATVLMICAIPIAVLTNAARVTGTGVTTYYFGKQAADGTWHEISGWLVYIVALVLLLGANYVLGKIFGDYPVAMAPGSDIVRTSRAALRTSTVLPLTMALVLSAVFINWFAVHSEAVINRRPLMELSSTLGEWRQKGSEIRFDEGVENVLGATDQTMREYTLPDGRVGNIYVGYYASQRAGSTYHSPQNCLPGAGWVMKDPQLTDITIADGRTFQANRYVIENGVYREVMIYWYQGRGRTEASEYRDKINTVLDGITRGRTDGALVRVMTGVGTDENAAVRSATDLSANLAEGLSLFVPE